MEGEEDMGKVLDMGREEEALANALGWWLRDECCQLRVLSLASNSIGTSFCRTMLSPPPSFSSTTSSTTSSTPSLVKLVLRDNNLNEIHSILHNHENTASLRWLDLSWNDFSSSEIIDTTTSTSTTNLHLPSTLRHLNLSFTSMSDSIVRNFSLFWKILFIVLTDL